MNRTEERLADALAAAAAAIRDDALRPAHAPQRPHRRGRGWLVPVAAAASAVIAISLAFAIPHLATRPGGRPFADVGTAASPPPYYVSVDENMKLRVRATATGRLTATMPPPYEWGGGTSADVALAASANGRLFAVAYHDWGGGRTLLYRFSLTSSGQVSGFAPVPGGALPGLSDLTLALSPTRSQIAVGGIPTHDSAGFGATAPAEIVLVNLHTGARAVLSGGMDRPHSQFTIASLSWERNGKALVFLALWCRQLLASPYNVECQSNGPVRHPQTSQLWEIDAVAPAHGLADGHLLLSGPPRYQSMVQALISPDGESAMVLGRRGDRLAVTRFATRTGRVLGVPHRVPKSTLLYAQLSSDGSGGYLIVNDQLGVVSGWLHDGRFHPFGLHVIISAITW